MNKYPYTTRKTEYICQESWYPLFGGLHYSSQYYKDINWFKQKQLFELNAINEKKCCLPYQ